MTLAPSEPLVLSYLRSGKTLRDLDAEHGVTARRSKSGDKLTLNYDMLRAKNGDRLAEQCRGLVVGFVHKVAYVAGTEKEGPWKDVPLVPDVVGPLRVLAWPMDRFYNLNDPHAAPVAWGEEGTVVEEKLDGTLCILYFDDGQQRWQVATRGVPEADVAGDGGVTFRDLFVRAAQATEIRACWAREHGLPPSDPDALIPWIFRDLEEDCTYCFELCTPDNRVVVPHAEDRIVLLAVRDRTTGREYNPAAMGLPIPVAPVWPVATSTDVVALVAARGGIACEGAIVKDDQYRRVKVKSAAWIALSGARAAVGSTDRSRLEALLRPDVDDTLALLDDVAPVDAATLRGLQEKLVAWGKEVDAFVREAKEEAGGDRKTFAAIVTTRSPVPFVCFALYAGFADNALAWIVQQFRAERLGDAKLQTVVADVLRKERRS